MKKIIVSALALLAFALPSLAQEKAKLILGVGGKASLYYLPLTIAEKKGYFKDEGLEIEINDFSGGSRSLQALIGGSVDAVTGAYEHTIRMQAKNQDVRAVIELGRFPAGAFVVRKDLADKVKSPADFKGLKIGITAPGSSTHLMTQFAMVKFGLKKDDASFIGVGLGATAVAAMKQKQIDVLMNLEPVISKLEADNDVTTLIDLRTEAGTNSLFGGTNPAAVLYLKGEFIEKNPITTQKLVNAFMRALKFIDTATVKEMMAVLPPEFLLGDAPTFEKALAASRPSFSKTGIIQIAGRDSIYAMLKSLEAEMANVNIDINKTFITTFVEKAQNLKP